MAEESLGILGHGPAGGGKTSLGHTGPIPTLIFDAETASKFIPRHLKKMWDPMKEGPPVYDGTWKFCVIKIDKWDKAAKALEFLRSNKHPFRTVVIDSISEILIKAKEEVNGRDQFQLQHWGRLSQNMGSFLRDLRDITSSAESKIQIMYLISTTKEYVKKDKAGEVTEQVWKPFLEGSTQHIVPYLFDMTAYIYLEEVDVDKSNPAKGKRIQQVFYTGSSNPNIAAKSRPNNVPPFLYGITLEQLFNNIFPPEVPAPEPVAVQAPVQAPVAAPQPVVAAPVPTTAPAPPVAVKKPSTGTKTGLPAMPTL